MLSLTFLSFFPWFARFLFLQHEPPAAYYIATSDRNVCEEARYYILSSLGHTYSRKYPWLSSNWNIETKGKMPPPSPFERGISLR